YWHILSPSYFCFRFLLSSSHAHCDLLSFPTRRSSDLGIQNAFRIGGVTLKSHTIGCGDEVIGILVKHTSPGVTVLAVLILHLKEALSGDGHVQITTGILLGAIFGEVLGNVAYLHPAGLTAGIQRSQLRATGFETCRGNIGNVLGYHIQALVCCTQATQTNIETHDCAPRNSLTLNRDRLPRPSTCNRTSPPWGGTLTFSTVRCR